MILSFVAHGDGLSSHARDKRASAHKNRLSATRVKLLSFGYADNRTGRAIPSPSENKVGLSADPQLSSALKAL